MDNKFKVLYKNNRGIELDTFLNQNRAVLHKKRIFYVIKANLDDKQVYKIGISEKGDGAATARLLDYVYNYGVSDDGNKCKGVKLYLLLANVYNPDVSEADAAVRKLETKAKAHLKQYRERGHERFRINIDDLLKYLETQELIADTENTVRKTPRLAAKEQGSKDAVKEIVGHVTDRRGVTKFDVSFLKYKDGTELVEQANKKLTYEQIIKLRHGKSTADTYIKKNKQLIK